MQVFLHMQNAARTDKGCMPNVITYSALITAFVAGGRLDKAYEIFLSMRSSNVRPDHICYSTLIAGALTTPAAPFRFPVVDIWSFGTLKVTALQQVQA